MNNNIKCTCGHSWSKASSSGKDMNVCHICGKDNTMKNGGWLNKYEQGGMVLDQQPDDNYGKKPNPNDVQASVGPDFVGLGYDTTGRNYSPAWGGQFAMGGALPGAVGYTYARTQNPAPSNGKYAKKTKASAQDGLLMNFEPEKMRSDATRVAPAVRPLTKKEQEENARINKENQKKTEERDKKIVAERQANKNTKGDLSTPGSWHTADKLRLFPSSVGGVGEMFDEYVNPAYVVGSLTDQLGESVARRDIGGAAATLAMTAGLGALGVDPLGDVMKAQRWSQGAVDRLGYNVQTAGPRLGSSTRSLESATAAERSQQQLDLIRQQRRSEAVSRGSQSTRAPYQFPTDEELAIMNAREAERYAPRVSRQSTGTPEDMTALDRFERIQQVDPGPSYAELMEYPSARRVSHSDQMIDQMNQSRSTLSNLHNESTPTLKWGEKDFKIGDARQSARYTDTEGNSFKQDVRDWDDTRIGSYKVEDPDGGYMELSTRQDLVDPNSYLEVSNMTFKNDIDAAAAKQFSKIMAHLPGKVNMGHISTSMYSQPLMNQQVARWANNNAGRIEVRNVDLETLNPWHKGMDFPDDPLKGYPKYGNRLDQTKQQFPKLQKTVKSMSKYTGVDLPEPRLEFFDMSLDVPTRRPITLEELNSEGFKRKLQQDPTLGNKVTIKAPTYELIKHYRNGGQIVDSMGQWAHPGKTTTIPGNDITMKGVNYDVLGVSNTGDKKLMKPGKNYKFDGDYVTEYPKGGWLNKYK